MATQKTLNDLLEKISKKLNLATSKEVAISKGLDKYLQLEHSTLYGGWRIVNVGINNGAHYGAFGCSGCEARLKSKLMQIKLELILQNINN